MRRLDWFVLSGAFTVKAFNGSIPPITLLRRLARANFGLSTSQFFDPEWYQERYQDVARSRLSSWRHFIGHGVWENRQMASWEVDQWFDDAVLDSVNQQYQAKLNKMCAIERQHVGWSLARRMASRAQWAKAKALIEESGVVDGLFDLSDPAKAPYGFQPLVLWLDICRHLGLDERSRLNSEHLSKCPDLGLALASWSSSPDEWSRLVSTWFFDQGLSPIEVSDLSFDSLHSSGSHTAQGPLVSVLVPAHNAQETIGLALKSLMNQTYRSLEILVIDDGSSDGTSDVVRALQAADERIHLLPQSKPIGVFRARNIGLAQSKGELMTVHDADDWSHPEKLERQVALLCDNPDLKGCLSSWARLSNELSFGGWSNPSNWVSWIHNNSSSFMFRRSVFDQLGYWDEVRCNGDVEYIERVKAIWGASSIKTVMPDIPLSFGRAHAASLTMQKETSILTTLKGSRRDYRLAYEAWHSHAKSASDLYLSRSPKIRPFDIPKAMLPQ